jgi:hypothetical protein
MVCILDEIVTKLILFPIYQQFSSNVDRGSSKFRPLSAQCGAAAQFYAISPPANRTVAF